MRRLPPLNALRAFEAAARHRSFTRAAAELHVTHGAVSRQVAQLERWLNVALFRRLPRQVVLTEEGERLLGDVAIALDRLSMSVANLSRRAAVPLLVSTPPTFAMRWLIPRLSLFLKRSPHIDIRLISSISPVDFGSGAYDLAIRRAKQPLPMLRCRAFLPDDSLPVCAPDVLEKQPLRTVSDLAHHTLITTTTERDAWSDWLMAAGHPNLTPKLSLNLEQLYFALQAAVEGLGIALAPFGLVADDVAAGRLVIPLRIYSRMRSYYAIHPDSRDKREAIDAFCSWLEEEGEVANLMFQEHDRRMAQSG